MEELKSLVAGSTGLVGGSLINELASRKIKVKGLVRKRKESNNPYIQYVEVDYDNLTEYQDEFQDVQDVYICLGTTIDRAGSKEAFQKVDIDYCIEVAKQGLEAGAKNLTIISSVGADSESSIFYLRTKGLVEKEVCKLKYESISIYRPGLLIGPRKDIRLGELVGQKIHPILNNLLLFGRLRKYRSIDTAVLARAMINSSGFAKSIEYLYFDDFIKLLRLEG
jgi:uncharacterized protein YbjT (DUF2867 family)|tara:strand:+ start:209 stop:877 length:669 start_codon:yes stop_codon:yes gene_type:complete